MTRQQGSGIAPHQVPYVLSDKYVVGGELLQVFLHRGVVVTPQGTNLGIQKEHISVSINCFAQIGILSYYDIIK
jgi:hypothetical protein